MTIMYVLVALALLGLAWIAFARSKVVEVPPDPAEESLSEIFPNLTESDWRWLQSFGGWQNYRIYPHKKMRR